MNIAGLSLAEQARGAQDFTQEKEDYRVATSTT